MDVASERQRFSEARRIRCEMGVFPFHECHPWHSPCGQLRCAKLLSCNFVVTFRWTSNKKWPAKRRNEILIYEECWALLPNLRAFIFFAFRFCFHPTRAPRALEENCWKTNRKFVLVTLQHGRRIGTTTIFWSAQEKVRDGCLFFWLLFVGQATKSDSPRGEKYTSNQ